MLDSRQLAAITAAAVTALGGTGAALALAMSKKGGDAMKHESGPAMKHEKGSVMQHEADPAMQHAPTSGASVTG